MLQNNFKLPNSIKKQEKKLLITGLKQFSEKIAVHHEYFLYTSCKPARQNDGILCFL